MELEQFIPYGRQDITQDDIDAVTKVLYSDFLTQGPCVPKFESAVSSYCNAKYAIATNSATSALHLACLSLELSKGDWLWTSSVTFVASANCGLYCGAKVDFVDINPVSYTLCPKALKKKLIQAKKSGKLPKVVIPVHLSGQSCDMKEIYDLAKEYKFKIIEDASHAIGGKYLGKLIGGCQYSDITIFSFHPVKIITSGEGGMALTNNSDIAKKLSLLRSHGITRDKKQMKNKPHGDWYYQQIDLGFNYRMTDIQAALGESQLRRVDQYVSLRNKLALRYKKFLSGLPLALQYQSKEKYSSFHLFVIRLKDQQKHKQVFQYLRENNIGINLHYIPVHMQPYYEKIDIEYTDLEQAELYYKEAISLPIYPKMTNDQQDFIIEALRRALKI